MCQKKVGNAVKRNRIKRRLKSTVQKLLKVNSAINSNYTYIIFGIRKVYEEDSRELDEADDASDELPYVTN